MRPELNKQFIDLWERYFGAAELPITFYYTDGDGGAEKAEKPETRSCLICELAKVRKGKSLWYNGESIRCGGAKRYLGYTDRMRPGFEYFLSCGNDQMEGERYIRTPEMVKIFMNDQKTLPVAGKNIVFKRWDKLSESDEPAVVIFFAIPDVLSGLFTLANFDQTNPDMTISTFGAGCSTIIHYPYLESLKDNPRAIIGMFDPSARPCVPDDVITFAVPMKRFVNVIDYMDESFLITDTWHVVKKRIDTHLRK